jgi:hypothetical protein
MKASVIATLLRAGRPELANIVTYGQMQFPSDLLRSLRTSAKYNDGLWKSEKQGVFLWKWAAGKMIQRTRQAAAWARSTGWYDAKDQKQLALQFVTVDERFGKRDPTKIRYNGAYALIDGTGVLAIASVKVKHPKAGEDTAPETIPSTAKTTFTRSHDVVPPINVDPAGDEARRKAKQLKENEPTIKAIESIPGWEEQKIFRDFHRILMAGGTLSPNMMRVVERNLPTPVMNVGSAEDVQTKMDELDRWVERVFFPPVIDDLRELDQQDYRQDLQEHERSPTLYQKPTVRDSVADMKQNWAQYRAGQDVRLGLHPFYMIDRFLDDELRINFFRLFKGARGVDWQAGYRALRPPAMKAIPKLKRGKPPTKTEMVVVRALLLVHDKLMGVGPDRVKQWLAKQ